MKKIIGYNILIVAIIIVLSEISLRLFSSINELGYQKNLFKPNSQITLHNSNVESIVFGNTVYTDIYGFRVPKADYNYNNLNKNNILILGDSVSFGVGVDEQKTFVGQIRNNYLKTNIFNTSVSGHNSSDHLNLLKLYYDTIKFEKVIIFYCLNDIVSAPGVITKKKSYEKNYLLLKINIFLRNKSFLYIYLKSKFTNPEKRYYDYIFPYYENQKSIEITNDIFMQISEFSKQKKLDTTVIILPYRYQVEKNNCKKELLYPQNVIEGILKTNKIKFFNLTSSFCEDKNSNNFFLKYDPVHLSIEGHQMVFNKLNKILKFNN